jgi:hypothetical protein
MMRDGSWQRVVVACVVWVASGSVRSDAPVWQRDLDAFRRMAASGQNFALPVTAGSKLAADYAVGVYVFYNNPQPFCYAYKIPGEWLPLANRPGVLQAKGGAATVGVNFRPPAALQGTDGATLVERGRDLVVRELERALHQPLVDVELVPFESARAGTWQLKAAPVRQRDGRTAALPLYILVDLSPHTIAEVNVIDSGSDDDLARQIVASLKTSSDPACFWDDLEGMLRAYYRDR